MSIIQYKEFKSERRKSDLYNEGFLAGINMILNFYYMKALSSIRYTNRYIHSKSKNRKNVYNIRIRMR
jgi:hypothetical protein